jgi:hypothetical protein
MTVARLVLALAAAGSLMLAADGHAQTSGAAPPTGSPPDQNAPQHFDSQGKKQNDDQSLSQRLDRSDGVIRPPTHVDRDMVQSPPPSADNEMAIKPPRDQQVKRSSAAGPV